MTPRVVEEVRAPLPIPLWLHPEWASAFPWLVQGTTGQGRDGFDLGLGGDAAVGRVLDRWRQVRQSLGFPTLFVGRQVHGASLALHDAAAVRGLAILDDVDGHVVPQPGVVAAVTVADCVPVFVIDPARRVGALLHAGWRGVAAGILERAVGLLHMRGSPPERLLVHLGPAICGACYEVGPEVHAAVRPDVPPPAHPVPLDLRAALADRAVRAGVPRTGVTRSAFCTRCHSDRFASHRAGRHERQAAVLGVRRTP